MILFTNFQNNNYLYLKHLCQFRCLIKHLVVVLPQNLQTGQEDVIGNASVQLLALLTICKAIICLHETHFVSA